MSAITAPDAVERIRKLNDAFRASFSGGKVVMTASVVALPEAVKTEALQKTADFNVFTQDNDPHDEHDFGAFELCDRKFFWKIDYYDRDLQYGSEDPADPDKTTRVLTLMMAEDY
jgi:hypothetical protein